MTVIKGDGTVEFRFYRPKAAEVHVAGDFNSWVPLSMPMEPQGDGWWVATATLPPGDYRFRYVADGNWYTDFASSGVERGPGGWNGVLVVPRRRKPALTSLTMATGEPLQPAALGA